MLPIDIHIYQFDPAQYSRVSIGDVKWWVNVKWKKYFWMVFIIGDLRQCNEVRVDNYGVKIA